MTFDSLYRLIYEQRTSDTDINQRLDSIIEKYGKPLFVSKTDEIEWNTTLYRTHKVIDPFRKTHDAKAPRQKVYWAKSLDTALIYVDQNTWGTSGQQFGNIVSEIMNIPSGFLTKAQPKYPDSLRWYKNFGVEEDMKETQDAYKRASEKSPGKTVNNIQPSNQYGNTPEDLQYNTMRYGQRVTRSTFRHPETALDKHEVENVQTDLLLKFPNKGFVTVPMNIIKKVDPELYRVIFWNRI
jgi:hypothetical protein